jgi:cytochrome c biogenesis protein CcmG/thiol:disulfide interchange protein DsbE
MRKGLLILLIVLGIGIAFAVATITLYEKTTPAVIGEEAPDFTLETIDVEVKSLSDFRGKPTTLVFFTTWCPSCRQQAPYITKFVKEHGDQIEIVYINRRDAKTMIKDFRDEFGVTYSIFVDLNDSQARPYGVTGQPEAFFIDENGILLYHHIGPMTDKFLLSKWEELWTS